MEPDRTSAAPASVSRRPRLLAAARFVLPALGPLAVAATWATAGHLRSPLAVHWTWQGHPNGFASLPAVLGWTAALYAFSWLYLLVLGRGSWGLPGARRRRLRPIARVATAYAVLSSLAGIDVVVLVANSHGAGSDEAMTVVLYLPLALLVVGALSGYLLARAAGMSNEAPVARKPTRSVPLEDHPDLFEVLKRVDDLSDQAPQP